MVHARGPLSAADPRRAARWKTGTLLSKPIPALQVTRGRSAWNEHAPTFRPLPAIVNTNIMGGGVDLKNPRLRKEAADGERGNAVDAEATAGESHR